MSFQSLGLAEALTRAVSEHGYTTPTPIQAQAIPAVIAGRDLVAAAQTGTGKTAGFVLPILQRLVDSAATGAPLVAATRPARSERGARHAAAPARRTRMPRALILTPTRELAAQVEASIRTYGKHVAVTSLAVFGGVGFGGQAAQLKRGVDILVATPGRLLDHQREGNLDLSKVEILVLDEADRMLDMGFIPDVKRIVGMIPSTRQTLMFSATFSDEIRTLSRGFLRDPHSIDVAPRNSTVERIAQQIHPVDRHRKAELLAFLIGHHRWSQVLVFTRTKHGADKLVHSLERDGITAAALHGNKSQNARTRALSDFKKGAVRALVATDIAARGIDIDALPQVVNFELPNVAEDYVHRIGRTGRAGAAGHAVSLVCIDERGLQRDIERVIKQSIPSEIVKGFEPDPSIAAQPVTPPRGRSPHQGRARAPGHGQGRPHDAEARHRGHGSASESRHGARGHAGTGTTGRTHHAHGNGERIHASDNRNRGQSHITQRPAGGDARTHHAKPRTPRDVRR